MPMIKCIMAKQFGVGTDRRYKKVMLTLQSRAGKRCSIRPSDMWRMKSESPLFCNSLGARSFSIPDKNRPERIRALVHRRKDRYRVVVVIIVKHLHFSLTCLGNITLSTILTGILPPRITRMVLYLTTTTVERFEGSA